VNSIVAATVRSFAHMPLGVSDRNSAKRFTSFLIYILVPFALNMPAKSHLTEGLKVPSSRCHCK